MVCSGNATRYIKRFLVAVPPDLRSDYPDLAHMFDADGYLKLSVAPGEYAPEDVKTGEGGYKVTFQKLKKVGQRTIRGYRITVPNSTAALFYLFTDLEALCNVQPHTPIEVKDFIRPEAEQFKAARNQATPIEPYTTRLGAIYEVTAGGGLSGTTGSLLFIGEGSSGFTFKFMEAASR